MSRNITLRWVDTNVIERGYNIYRSTEKMSLDSLPEPINTVPRDQTEYIDTNVPDDVAYFYRVGAYIDGHEVISDEIFFKSTNEYLFTASNDGSIHKIDSSGTTVWSYTNDDVMFTSVNSDPVTGRVITSTSNNSVKLLDLNASELWESTEHTSTVNAVSFSYRGNPISTSYDQTLIEYASDGEVLTTKDYFTSNITSVDDRFLLRVGQSNGILRGENVAEYVSLSGGSIKRAFTFPNQTTVVLMSGGNLILVDNTFNILTTLSGSFKDLAIYDRTLVAIDNYDIYLIDETLTVIKSENKSTTILTKVAMSSYAVFVTDESNSLFAYSLEDLSLMWDKHNVHSDTITDMRFSWQVINLYVPIKIISGFIGEPKLLIRPVLNSDITNSTLTSTNFNPSVGLYEAFSYRNNNIDTYLNELFPLHVHTQSFGLNTTNITPIATSAGTSSNVGEITLLSPTLQLSYSSSTYVNNLAETLNQLQPSHVTSKVEAYQHNSTLPMVVSHTTFSNIELSPQPPSVRFETNSEFNSSISPV